MKRQFAIFLFASTLIVLFGFTLVPRTLADLAVFYPSAMDLNSVVVTLGPNGASVATPAELASTQEILAQRLEQLKLDGPYTVQAVDNQLQVTLPRTVDTPYIADLVSHVGNIEFVVGDAEVPAIGQLVATSGNSGMTNDMPVYKSLFTGQDIAQVVPPGATSGDIFYQISLSPATLENLNSVDIQQSSFICIVLDNEVTHCSTMYHLSDNTLDILLNVDSSTNIDPIDLAVLLNSGPLPMPLEVVGK